LPSPTKCTGEEEAREKETKGEGKESSENSQ
jgi:hypothetical protein